jgi:putative oxidoreductase
LGDADGNHRGFGRGRDGPGFRTREFALLLVFFNLGAAVIGHPFWSITGDATARWGQFIHFWKDIGLAGGALFVLARGAGPLSYDRG